MFDGPMSVKLCFPHELSCLFKLFDRKVGVDSSIAVAVRPNRVSSPYLNHPQRIWPEIAFATEYAVRVRVGVSVLCFIMFDSHLILLKEVFDARSDRPRIRVSRSLFRLAGCQNIFYMIQICGWECVKSFLERLPSPRHRVNRDANSLTPPSPLMNLSSGSEWALICSAYRNTRDHLDRVRLSTLAGSEVQRITAANGSSRSDGSMLCKRKAQRARSAIITTDANARLADIHDRMPVILSPSDYIRWLSEEADPRDLLRLMVPTPA
jgi:hypothetical protein